VPKTYRLVVFTRYPIPGQTKTRLIPRLGAEGAAQIQRQLTEHTLAIVQDLMTLCRSQQACLGVDIWFTGGDRALMQAWLGEQWHYVNQGGGNLGDRLIRAFQSSDTGIAGTVVIGIDCPGITAQTLWNAFMMLGNHDLVIGPATDGGYYLIGMTHPIPDLFSGITWSTDQVLAQTLAIAHRLDLTVAALEPLSDVDHPEDLAVWHRVQTTARTSSHHDPGSFCDSPHAERSSTH
jgi:uncharacterized protein